MRRDARRRFKVTSACGIHLSHNFIGELKYVLRSATMKWFFKYVNCMFSCIKTVYTCAGGLKTSSLLIEEVDEGGRGFVVHILEGIPQASLYQKLMSTLLGKKYLVGPGQLKFYIYVVSVKSI